jgi:hypothetical protein
MFVFKKYDRQNHVWSFMTKYLRFLCKFTSWSGDSIYQYFMSINSFSTPYLFLYTAARLQWPVTQNSRSQQFFLNKVVPISNNTNNKLSLPVIEHIKGLRQLNAKKTKYHLYIYYFVYCMYWNSFVCNTF